MSASADYAVEEAPTVEPRRRWRIVLSILIPVALLVALLAWAFASPIGASPDEDYHMGSIWCAQGNRAGLCESTADPGIKLVPEAVTKAAKCFAFHPERSGSCPIEDPNKLVQSKRGSFNDNGYPPLYYLTMSVFVSSNTALSILLMRAFNAILFVGLVSALFVMLRKRHRGIVLWGSLAALVPFGMFIIPSVNPSGWASVSAMILWLALVGYYEARSRGRLIGLGALATVATLMGAGARADAATFSVLAMVIAVVLKAERSRRFALLSILPVVLAVVCVAFFFSASQGGVINPETSLAPLSGRQALALITTNLLQLQSLWSGSFGFWGLGWLDTAMPPLVSITSFSVVCGIGFFGLRRTSARKTIALALAGLALIVVPLYVLVHDRIVVGAGVQPRYVYPLILLFFGLCLYGMGRLNVRMSWVQLALIVVGLALANEVALHVNLRRYVTGTVAQGVDLDAGQAWWWSLPFSPNSVWVIGSIAFFVALAAAAAISWPRRLPSSGLRKAPELV